MKKLKKTLLQAAVLLALVGWPAVADYKPPNASDAAYDATAWNGDTTHAPSKNAVRDKIEALPSDTATFTNKSLNNASVFHVDGSDPTKKVAFDSSLLDTGRTGTIQFAAFPSGSPTTVLSNGTMVTTTGTANLTNKTLDTTTTTFANTGGNVQSLYVTPLGSANAKSLGLTYDPTGDHLQSFQDLDGTLALLTDLPTHTQMLQNFGLSAAISSNTLVVSLKQADGSTNPAAGTGAVKASFRGTTATNGNFTTVSFTAANSITLGTTDSIGLTSGVASVVYVYLVSDTTSEICLSATLFDDGNLTSASALTGGADTTATTLWCTSAHTSKPIRLVGNLSATWSNPNWGSITVLNARSIMSDVSRPVVKGQTTEPRFCAFDIDFHSGTPTKATEYGGCVSSVPDTGTGHSVVAISTGYWSAAPICTVMSYDDASDKKCKIATTAAPTSTTVDLACSDNTSVTDDCGCNVICIGPH